MRQSIGFTAAAALFLSAGWLRADDGCTIKRKVVAAGDVYQVQKNETATLSTKVKDASGKALLDTKQVTVETSVFRETVLKCDGKLPTQLQRTYERAQLTTDGNTTALPYQGKTVLIEKKDGCYYFTQDGKELTGEDAQLLVKEFALGAEAQADLERAIVPATAVKVNDTWKLDLTQFAKATAQAGAMEIDTARGKGTATLLKVYPKDDRQFGEVKVSLTLPIKSLGKGILKVTTQDGSVAVVDLDLNGNIDGSCNTTTIKNTTKMDAKAFMSMPDGSKVPMVVSMQSQAEEVRTEVSKTVTMK